MFETGEDTEDRPLIGQWARRYPGRDVAGRSRSAAVGGSGAAQDRDLASQTRHPPPRAAEGPRIPFRDPPVT